ncbi:hypothetical protein [Falsarthrobacter nasiphocae]|uniref:hypothetical protein n=1 Tax=Falsarthrobacter nasiphocae TaxID=189863 RepID=UPI0031CF8E35
MKRKYDVFLGLAIVFTLVCTVSLSTGGRPIIPAIIGAILWIVWAILRNGQDRRPRQP